MSAFTKLRDSIHFLTHHSSFQVAPIRAWLRVFLWYFQIECGLTPTCFIREWNVRFELPRRRKTPAKVFYVFGRGYEEEVDFFDHFLRVGDRFIDIGANFGLYTLQAAAKVGPEGRVDAFEPFPESFALLQRNIERNRFRHVHAFPVALGETSDAAVLSIHADPGRNSIGALGASEVATVPIRMEPLDTVLPDPSRPVDAIKIDVEGWELPVFRGAREILIRSHPVVVFEVNDEACRRAGSTVEQLLGYLGSLDYEFYRYEGGRRLRWEIPKGFGNWIAIHREALGRFADWHLEGNASASPTN